MWTDGVLMASEVIFEVRDVIGAVYGKEYVLDSLWMYKFKVKNA